MSRSVLITGAGGFVGSHLAQGFAAMGDVVTGTDAMFDGDTRRRLAGVAMIEGELTTALAGLPRFDLVVHGAALTSTPEEMSLTPAAHIRANVDLLLASLDFAIRTGAEAFVFLSSSGVFEGSDAKWLLETTPACSTTAYGLAKRAGELLLGAAGDGLRVVAVRLGPIYGPHERVRATRQRMSPVRQWLDAAAAGRPIVVESPRSVRDWTFAPDLARAISALLAKSPTGVVHLCAPQVASDETLARQLGELTGAAIELRESAVALRRPMSSERIDLPRLIDWTPLSAGLANTLALDAIR